MVNRGNPTVNRAVAYVNGGQGEVGGSGRLSTWSGLTAKSLVLVGIVITVALASSVVLQNALATGDGSMLTPLLIVTAVSFLPMLIISFVIFRVPRIAPILSSIYCVLLGISVGLVSSLIDMVYSGVALLAIMGTAVVFVTTIVAHRLMGGRVSSKFRRFVFIALISFLVVQLVSVVISLLSNTFATWVSGAGIQMLFSGIAIVIATFTLLIDIDNMTRLVGSADKQYEWIMAFSLITTLVWLYLEILRMLALLANRRN